jgi:hypothetical protein
MSRVYFDAVKEYVADLCDLLRLRDWTVEIATEYTDHDEAWGTVNVMDQRYHVTVKLCRDFPELTSDQQRLTLVHELLHVYLDPIDFIIRRTVEPLVGKSTWIAVEQVLERDIELAVDKLAESVAPLCPVFKPPS